MTDTSSLPGLITSSQPAYAATLPHTDDVLSDQSKLPDDFDPFKHIQSQYIPLHNELVNHWFHDTTIAAPGGNWFPNLASPRSSSRVACTMTPHDNQLIMMMRHHLFFDLLGYGKTDLFLYQSLVTTLINVVTTERASITPPTDANINILTDIRKFKFAKLSLIKVLGQTQATGRVIGVGYTKINTETVSTPFGRGTATETYTAAIAAIKANTAYTGFINATPPTGTQATNKIVIYPEAETA
ncbi:hypothetical protein [Nostoc sp.]|uniref:hypothetical protein n=1 Tax=Nostoc sp. TaxID=1180 RepID=UPI002FF74142